MRVRKRTGWDKTTPQSIRPRHAAVKRTENPGPELLNGVTSLPRTRARTLHKLIFVTFVPRIAVLVTYAGPEDLHPA